MSIKSNKIFLILALFSLSLTSCGGSTSGGTVTPGGGSAEVIPSNLTLTITIQGVDSTHSNGDGSGVISCTASAKDAVSYGFRFGNGSEISSASGKVNYTYTDNGTNTHTISVYAYSSTGNSINTSKDVTVTVTTASYSTLVFSDEFDVDGAPNQNNWAYDLGAGGWGNAEKQYYTNKSTNISVTGGVLKITAKKETFNGSEYTAARIKTQGKFSFKYGRVDVRAKLPATGGTWPAIWMLGSNIGTVGWPACGEVDIMEHVGNDLGKIHASVHTPSSSGNTINTATKLVADAATAFHVYSINWSARKIEFLVDDVLYYTYNPTTKNSSTWPFDANQFIILNVAMGGTFGGNIDPNFTSDTMEIDYVHVYQ